ncbi:MAG: glycosyltransferase involved in cell wall biosynthesis [Crocinitomix sp.]|jgi:glycosyltransferase involved in cell wall biosynthesis
MISIIIPCFNSGQFLKDAIESIKNSGNITVETIIVNDGSTDDFTIDFLGELEGKGIKVIHQDNQGPAAARNKGVNHSKGEYLLFLDSDNKVRPEYVKTAKAILDSFVDVGVVYAKPHFIGSVNDSSIRFNTHSFSFDALLAGNYIDMCSLVRRQAFLEVNGFDEERDLIGWEDADLWIRIAQTRWKFYFIDEVLFDYRVRTDSLMGVADQNKRELMLNYLGKKHGFIIHQRYRQYFRLMEKIQEQPFSYFLRILFYKYILRSPFIK